MRSALTYDDKKTHVHPVSPNVSIKDVKELGSKLNFDDRVDRKLKKCGKLIGRMRRFRVNLPQNVSLANI